MSILLVSPLAAAMDGLPIDIVLLVLSGVSLGLALFTGVLPPRKLPGPDRIPVERSAWPLAAVLFGGAGCYLFAISAIASLWSVFNKRGVVATTQPFDSDSGIALLSTVPSVFGFFGLLLGDSTIYEAIRQDLGLRFSRLPRGLSSGFIAGLIVLPPLYLTAQIMELVYRAVHYQHPTEHPLLRVLGERPSSSVMGAIILGACVLAPLWEEFLFRGHLQTLILRFMQYLSGLRRGNTDTIPIAEIAPSDAPLGYEATRTSPHPAWTNWFAILITSLLFAGIHPTWSFPIIFALSICLGYAYERTGNLWVSITMHAMFNTASTVLFLAGAGSH